MSEDQECEICSEVDNESIFPSICTEIARSKL